MSRERKGKQKFKKVPLFSVASIVAGDFASKEEMGIEEVKVDSTGG